MNDNAWQKAILPVNSTLEDIVNNMNNSSFKIVLIVNKNNQLVGTVSDGDIRRGLLKGLDLHSSIEQIVHRGALVVPPGMGSEMVLKIMTANKIQQVPIVDEKLQIVGLHIWDEIASPPARQNLMVIMAGGKGTRLLPLTENCPKPLVEVAGKPMLEHIIIRAKNEGVSHFLIAINYLGHMIEDYFGDGSKFGVNIDYIREETPLGTAGALSLLVSRPKTPFIVTNGDLITDISYGDLLDFHKHHNAIATMAVRSYEWQHPFGVVQTRGVNIIGFKEKPITRSHINAGIYVLSPEALDGLIKNEPFDMPSLFVHLQEQSKTTVAYPMHEPWLDLGMPEELKKAQVAIELNG